MINLKIINYFLVIIVAILTLCSCGSGAGNIKILRPDNQQDPFINLIEMQQYSSMYFRFLELRAGFSSICDTSGVEIWYPQQFGEGIKPDNRSFDINNAGLTQGKSYRVELYAKNDYNSTASPWDGEFYGYPDCPLLFEKGAASKINICFGLSAPDPVCSGSGSSSSPVCTGMTPSFDLCTK